MPTIDDLTQLAPPPAEARDTDCDWLSTEADLGISLPADYQQLVTRYGHGRFHDITPLSPRDLVETALDFLPGNESFRDEFPEYFPFPLYPEPGGLLPWAADGNGVHLCWLTSGPPDQWPVVVWSAEERWEKHTLNATGFLIAYLAGEITWPRSPQAPYFEPHIERRHVYIRLSEGQLPYETRLEILRDCLAPTAGRGGFANGETRQDHFKALQHNWLLTYETAYGHQIRVAFPPEDEAKARNMILTAAQTMGCEVLRATTHRGEPTWDGGA